MKWLLVLSSVLVAFVNAQDTCYFQTVQGCRGAAVDFANCTAEFSGFKKHANLVAQYANTQIEKSFDYLLLAANFGTYVRNRPGFEKQFRALSDKSWNNGIELIKYIAKRGGTHSFVSLSDAIEKKEFDLNEIEALALTLDYEKSLAKEAHRIHEKYVHFNHPPEYDPAVAHFLEEEFFEDQANTIRKLSGYGNDLKRLLTESKDSVDVPLSLYLFDEYLAKQE